MAHLIDWSRKDRGRYDMSDVFEVLAVVSDLLLNCKLSLQWGCHGAKLQLRSLTWSKPVMFAVYVITNMFHYL